MKNLRYDVLVIGGGVIGGTILRKLSQYNLSVCLVEKENDVCMGQSRANSGIVHAGFDAAEGSLKAKFNVLGNRMMPALAGELGVKYRNNTSLVVAFSEEELEILQKLQKRGVANGIAAEDLPILTREELLALEPYIHPAAKGALLAKTGGIICPYELTIAAIGNAMDNGAKLYTDFAVCAICKTEGGYTVTAEDGRSLQASVVINCAGLASGKIAALVGDDIPVHGRKGDYILLDRQAHYLTDRTLFFTPTAKGKGILVSSTVDNNIILGPTATEVESDVPETTAADLAHVMQKAKEMCPNVPLGAAITSFAGIRAYNERHDFIIEESQTAKGVFHLAGIESPGLTSAPAIAEYVAEELVARYLPLVKKENFRPERQADSFFRNLTTEEKNAVIQKDPAYGRMVCRCERITEGEIRHAVRTNPPATNVDAVKRRTRAGMGRCQGGFCQSRVTEILAEELGIPMEKVTKSGGNSVLLVGKIK